MLSLPLLFRSDLMILGVGKLLQMILLFFAVRLFTTYLSDQEIGNLILMVSVASFFGMAVINPVGSFINRKLNSWKETGQIFSNFISFNYYVVLISLLTLIVPYLLSFAGIGDSLDTLYFSLALFLFVFFNTWNQTIIPSLNLLFYRKQFVIFTLLSTSLYLMLSTLLVQFFEPTAISWIFGQSFGLALGFFMALVFFLKVVVINESKSLPDVDWAGIRRVSRFSLPLSLATLLFWVLGNSYKLIIEGALSAEELAYIGLGLSLATSLAGAIETLLMQVFQAPFYKGISECDSIDERARLFQSFINNTIPVMGAALFMLIAISPFVLAILADSRFISAYIFLMCGLLIEFLRVSVNIISHAAHSELQTHKNIIPYLWGALIASLSIFLSVFSAHWQWLVIVALIFSWLITLLLMVRSAKRLLNFTFPWQLLARLVLYILPVIFVSYWLWNQAANLAISMSFTCIAGLYTAMILYKQFLRTGADV